MCTIRTNILVLLLHIDSVLNILYHNNLLIAYNITYNIKDCMLGKVIWHMQIYTLQYCITYNAIYSIVRCCLLWYDTVL